MKEPAAGEMADTLSPELLWQCRGQELAARHMHATTVLWTGKVFGVHMHSPDGQQRDERAWSFS